MELARHRALTRCGCRTLKDFPYYSRNGVSPPQGIDTFVLSAQFSGFFGRNGVSPPQGIDTVEPMLIHPVSIM